VSKKEAEKRNKTALRIHSDFTVEAGYAYLFDKASAALYVSADYLGSGVQLYFVSPDFWVAGIFYGWRGAFSLGQVGLLPYVRFGVDYQNDKGFSDFGETSSDLVAGIPVALMVQGGLKVTTSKVPGLFVGGGFQYNLFNLMNDGYEDKMKMAVTVTAGYAF
jgi:hypothetical protein